MMIQSKQNRNFIVMALLNFIPDLIIAGIVTAVMDEGLFPFIAVIVGLQVVYLALWIKTSVWVWTVFMLRDKKFMVQHLVDFLQGNNFPKPDEYLSDGESYLADVMDNESLDVETRLLAAVEAGTVVAIRGFSRFQELMRITIAWEGAIEEHNRLCVSKNQPD